MGIISHFLGWMKSNPQDQMPKLYQLSMQDEKFIRFPVADMRDPNVKSLLRHIWEIVPTNLYKEVFPAGGFVSHLAGVTKSHDDIDLFCLTDNAFDQMVKRYQQLLDRGFDIKPQEGFATDHDENLVAIHVRGKGSKIIKFIFNGVNIDVVSAAERLGADNDSVTGLLRLFDWNWSMAALDLESDEIVAHIAAGSNIPQGNRSRMDENIDLARQRLRKYTERLVKLADNTKIHQTVGWLDKREKKLKEQEQREREWY